MPLKSAVRPTVHTNLSRKRSFSKTLLKLGESENGAFRKRSIASQQSRDFPDRLFFNHKSKMIGDCGSFKFLRRSVDGRNLIFFQNETSVSKCGRGLIHPSKNSFSEISCNQSHR